MPKKTKVKTRGVTKKKTTKKKAPKGQPDKRLALLKKLESKLGVLTKSIRQPKNGEAKLRFFLNSKNETVALLFYGFEKIFYWGKVEGKIFIFDRSVPIKFLPKGNERIDLSDSL